MSVAARVSPAPHPRSDGFNARFVIAGASALWIPLLSYMLISDWNDVVRPDLPKLAAWTALILAIWLLPVRSWNAELFAADYPVMIAAALLFSPAEAALVSFIGSLDAGELSKGRLLKTTFNHSQISCSWFVASMVAHSIAPHPAASPILVPLALLALLVNSLVNYVLVAVPLALQLRSPLSRAISHLRIGSLSDFGLAFLAGGSMAAMIAVLYEKAGSWVVPLFLAPTLLTRQALLRSQMLLELDKAYHDKQKALEHMADQIDRERSEERRLIAADLHDDVMQPLFRIGLFTQVLRSDLATGRLMELEEDLPQLLSASEEASSTIRKLVGDLRKSGLGSGGLRPALARLAAVMQEQTKITISSDLAEVDPSPGIQLALYQIAKEAVGNALRHSQAKNIWIELKRGDGLLRLMVQDDGTGFDPTVVPEHHFGLLIMRERASSVGGSLYVDSTPGEGCKVQALVPERSAE
jgi:signal transduction histidine kinase